MIYKYEIECRKAGLSEEQTNEIRKMFDKDKKTLKRERKSIQTEYQENGVRFFSMSETPVGDEDDYFDVEDPDTNVEEEVIHKLQLERLRELLSELSEEDRNLLLAYHSGYKGCKKEYLEAVNLTKRKANYRIKALLKQLREDF